jgi:prepilin-type N-terminal cleavage/methylation domain-containing protein
MRDIILIPVLRDLQLPERRLFAVFETLFERHRELQARRADEGFDGFTLIELLIVIVVIAILAATVIFALGGITGSSAQAACNSDAKSVETAVAAFQASPSNNGTALVASTFTAAAGTTPATMANVQLTGNAVGGPYLKTFPQPNSHYTIANAADGTVNVYKGVGTTTLIGAYDSPGTANPCDSVS